MRRDEYTKIKANKMKNAKWKRERERKKERRREKEPNKINCRGIILFVLLREMKEK